MKAIILLVALVAAVAALPRSHNHHWKETCCPEDLNIWNRCRGYATQALCMADPNCMWCPYSQNQLTILLDLVVGTGDRKGRCQIPTNPPVPSALPTGLCYSKVGPSCIFSQEQDPIPAVPGEACSPALRIELKQGKCPKPPKKPHWPWPWTSGEAATN